MEDKKLVPYHELLSNLTEQFEFIEFDHIFRNKNHCANALAVLASWLMTPEGSTVRPIEVIQQDEPAYCFQIDIAAEMPDGKPWFADIQNFLENQEFPEDASKQERRYIRRS